MSRRTSVTGGVEVVVVVDGAAEAAGGDASSRETQTQETGAQETQMGRRQRRPRLAGGARSKMVGVRVTPEEQARLAARAVERGTTVQGLLLAAALSEEVEGADQVAERRQLAIELMRVQRLIGGTADNMNQVARKANTVHEVPSDFGRVIGEARATWFKCEEILDQLVVLNRKAGA